MYHPRPRLKKISLSNVGFVKKMKVGNNRRQRTVCIKTLLQNWLIPCSDQGPITLCV
jgi:hypothetical protein